jgi:DNA polymerase III delta subunit
MLALIYGTKQIAIRNFILKSAQEVKASTIKEYNLDDDAVNAIESTLQTDIFGQSALNVIDISKILKAQLEKLFDAFKRYPTANIILVTTKDLEATSPVIKVVRAFKGKIIPATVARPNEVFKFLDDLFSKREVQCYRSLQKLLEIDNDPVYILVMLQYQLKNIALVKFGLGKKLPPFQLSSAQRQAQNFSEQQILDLYELLYQYDVTLKTGRILPEAVALLATQKILAG